MGVPLGFQKILFQRIEDGGGILNYHNKKGSNERMIKDLLDEIGQFWEPGSQLRISAGRCVRYWYHCYCKNDYDKFYKKFGVTPNLESAKTNLESATISPQGVTAHKSES